MRNLRNYLFSGMIGGLIAIGFIYYDQRPINEELLEITKKRGDLLREESEILTKALKEVREITSDYGKMMSDYENLKIDSLKINAYNKKIE